MVLRKYRVPLRDLQTENKKAIANGDGEDSPQPLQFAGDTLPECPAPKIVVPEGFKLDQDGTSN